MRLPQRELEVLSIGELENRLAAARSDEDRMVSLMTLAWKLAPSDVDRAQSLYGEARALNQALRLIEYDAHLARCQAHILHYRGEYTAALEQLDLASQLYMQARLQDDWADVIELLRASTWLMSCNYLAAHDAAERGLALAEAREQAGSLTTALNILGSLATLRENHALAVSCFQRCIPIYEERGFVRGLGKVHNNLGQAYLAMGRMDEALDAAQKALNYYREAANLRGETYVNNLLGKVYEQLGQLDLAEVHHRCSLRAAEQLQDVPSRLRAQHELAYLKQMRGDHSGAISDYHALLEGGLGVSAEEIVADTHRELAVCYEHLGEAAMALHHLREHMAVKDRITSARIESELRQSQARVEAQLARKDAELAREKAEVERLKAAEASRRLEHADRLTAVGKIAAGIAHEINNPLQVIYGNLLLLAEDGVSAKHAETLATTVENIERIVRLVAGMREMYQYEAQPPEPIDLSHAVRAVSRLAARTIERQRVHLKLELAPDLPRFMASTTHIHQVIFNLVLNALNAMPEGGELTLHTCFSSTDDCLLLEVRDTGSGLTPEVQAQAFEPFFTTRSDGSGLGLTICQTIASRYDGMVQLTNREEGGACASVCFRLHGARHGTYPGR